MINISRRQAALIAGLGFLISFVGAIFSGGFGNSLIIPGDGAGTFENLSGSLNIFRTGILSWLLVIFGDLVRAWALYIFFKDINKSVAMLSAWFMLLHDAIFATSLSFLALISFLANGIELNGFNLDQLQSLILLLFNGFNYGFEFGLFFFSFHLALLGYLVSKTNYIPKIFSLLLYLAAFGYLLNSAGTLFPSYPEMMKNILILPCLIGELAIMVWLTYKGGKDIPSA